MLVRMGWGRMGQEERALTCALADPGHQTISRKLCLCRFPLALLTAATHKVLPRLPGNLMSSHLGTGRS